jgi:hypothetical protein
MLVTLVFYVSVTNCVGIMLLLSYLLVETGFWNSYTKWVGNVFSAILSGIGKVRLGKRLPRVSTLSVNVYREIFIFFIFIGTRLPNKNRFSFTTLTYVDLWLDFLIRWHLLLLLLLLWLIYVFVTIKHKNNFTS